MVLECLGNESDTIPCTRYRSNYKALSDVLQSRVVLVLVLVLVFVLVLVLVFVFFTPRLIKVLLALKYRNCLKNKQ